jgi:predicted TPR repeat methyltransferase
MVTNLDFSEEMLEKAREKYAEAGILGEFVNMDIRELYSANLYDCAISTFDTLNYFLEEDELKDIFKRVYNSLKDEGLFIFDMNTLHKFQSVLGKEVYNYNKE